MVIFPTQPQQEGLCFAKKLRRKMTVAEKVLWKQLRAKRFNGHKFRRQVSIGPFIVDFLCIEKRLVVEVDGETHLSSSARAYDARRDRFFLRNGFRILRVTNEEA